MRILSLLLLVLVSFSTPVLAQATTPEELAVIQARFEENEKRLVTALEAGICPTKQWQMANLVDAESGFTGRDISHNTTYPERWDAFVAACKPVAEAMAAGDCSATIISQDAGMILFGAKYSSQDARVAAVEAC